MSSIRTPSGCSLEYTKDLQMRTSQEQWNISSHYFLLIFIEGASCPPTLQRTPWIRSMKSCSQTKRVSTICSLDRHCRMKRIDMAIELDPELRLTRRRSPDMQNFEPDLSMTAPRPYAANLGPKKAQNNFLKSRNIFGSKIGRDRVGSGFLQVE